MNTYVYYLKINKYIIWFLNYLTSQDMPLISISPQTHKMGVKVWVMVESSTGYVTMSVSVYTDREGTHKI